MPHRRLTRSPLAALAAGALVALGAAVPTVARAAPVEMNAEEFKLYKDYLDALTDERVQKMPEKKRLPAIAKNFKVSEKALVAAVEKGQKAGADAAKQCEAEVKALLEAGPLKGRLHDLKVDDSAAHVVTFVAWKNLDSAKLEEEAAVAALAASKGAPITSTVAVWAVDAAGRKVFSAKISAEPASRFNADRIPMFAATRYIKQFEDVHNTYKGTPPPETN